MANKTLTPKFGKPLTYREMITQSEEDKKRENLDLDVEAGALSMATSIHECNKRIVAARQNVTLTRRAIPLTPDAIIEAQNDLALHLRELEQLETLKKELFT